MSHLELQRNIDMFSGAQMLCLSGSDFRIRQLKENVGCTE